jgi:hypothetical protein
MANFQKTTLIIAGVLLIICLITLSIILYYASNSQVWPPFVASCPDYWIEKNDGTCINPKNLGNCGTFMKDTETPKNFNVAPYIGSNGDCQKQMWANSCNVSWDGITYGVSNLCS